MKTKETYTAKPFVKWVGGKTQLLEDIKKSLPENLEQVDDLTYIEPFVGGGAVLFWILQEYPNIRRAVINDINKELICTYLVIKDNVSSLISELRKMQSEFLPLGDEGRKEYFLSARKQFNSKDKTEVQTAALFIFLNRTCFNGLYRVNSKGEFNVPFGRYANPKICDEKVLLADSELLQKVEILCGDFSQTGKYAGSNVLYYFDPPYRPLTETAAFTSYSTDGFDDQEQTRLRDFCNVVSNNHSLFVASNSDPHNADNEDNFFDDLYEMFNVKRVSAARMINAKGDGRGAISEIMITNI